MRTQRISRSYKSCNHIGYGISIAPPRSTGIVDRIEERKQKGGPEGTQVFSIRLSGSF